MGNKKTGLWDR